VLTKAYIALTEYLKVGNLIADEQKLAEFTEDKD
jgi:hypothetical protein